MEIACRDSPVLRISKAPRMNLAYPYLDKPKLTTHVDGLIDYMFFCRAFFPSCMTKTTLSKVGLLLVRLSLSFSSRTGSSRKVLQVDVEIQ